MLADMPTITPKAAPGNEARVLFEPASPIPPGVIAQLTSAGHMWAEASQTSAPAERFRLAHLAALRGAAAVLASRPGPTRPRAAQPTSAWRLLDRSAPEFAGWSAYFRDSAVRRAAIEGGATAGVEGRDADDLLRAVNDFLTDVARVVGLTSGQSTAPEAAGLRLRQAS